MKLIKGKNIIMILGFFNNLKKQKKRALQTKFSLAMGYKTLNKPMRDKASSALLGGVRNGYLHYTIDKKDIEHYEISDRVELINKQWFFKGE